ncbi:cytochrome P450 [Heliocybe sulcata]|uniref:Cytochrome P450 n=1 Tax=Heliocybe sulcata TaxID=5364 RepID=A0A5C3NAS5_9AGAM|nr:cytochrome P450 [Heliocybe sulcata]
MPTIVALGTLLSVLLGVLFLRRTPRKSSLDKVPGPAAESFLTGHLLKLFDPSGPFHKNLVNAYGQVVKIQGLLGADQLYITDPRAISYILANDNGIFESPRQTVSLGNVLFGPGLGGVSGPQHKKQRKVLNPVFAPGHIKQITPTLFQVGRELQDLLSARVKSDGTELDVLRWCTRASIECLGRGILGYSFGDLDGQNQYADASNTLIPNVGKLRVFVPLLPLLRKLCPASLQRPVISALAAFWPNLKALKHDIDVLSDTALRIYNDACGASQDHLTGDDKNILTMLIEANSTVTAKEHLTRDEILGIISIIMFAGSDTTSNTLVRILEILARNPDVQARLKNELLSAFAGANDIEHGTLVQLPYLDAVVKETLRLHPPLVMMDRHTNEDAALPLLDPVTGTDQREISSIPVPRGTIVWMAIAMNNANEKVWGSDAKEFKPERWLSDLPPKLADAKMPGVLSPLMTFLGGPRACIGYRFPILEIKVLLASLLQCFEFRPSAAHTVHWRLAHIQAPYTENRPDAPSMPLCVLEERL